MSAASILVSRRFFEWAPRSLAFALDHKNPRHILYRVVFDMPQCGNTRAYHESNGGRSPPAKTAPRTIQNQIRLARGKTLHGLQQTARTNLGKDQDFTNLTSKVT